MSFMKSLFRVKSAHHETHHQNTLRKCLTATDLTLLGIGAIIGAGIFVLTGIAAATKAGPAIIFSYILASFACGFSALAYAELAASVGGCGSAYGYAFAGIGEFIAWIIGWDLLLEYSMVVSTVSIGWGSYLQNALQAIGITLPARLLTDPFHGGMMNLPPALIILLLASVLTAGAKQSARFNQLIVYTKLFVIAIFIAIALFHFDIQNWKPFLPFGLQGIVNGAGLIFFAYIGFDAVSTAAEETINPGRDLPRGIMASLLICTVTYAIVSALLTGMIHYPQLNVSSPVSTALLSFGYRFAASIVSIGAIAGLTTVILVMFYGFTRVFLAMARDGLLPNLFVKIDTKRQTPNRLIWFIAIIMAFIAGFIPINEVANLTNIGTLSAFVAVCCSVVVMRYTKPDMKRPFKTPYSPYLPILGAGLCLYLMSSLPAVTWISFGIWTAIGLIIYFAYSRHNSVARMVCAES